MGASLWPQHRSISWGGGHQLSLPNLSKYTLFSLAISQLIIQLREVAVTAGSSGGGEGRRTDSGGQDLALGFVGKATGRS